MAKAKVTIKELRAAAEDFNSFMEFEEGEEIATDSKVTLTALKKEIVETAGELDEDDIIQAVTADTLKKMNIEINCQIEGEDEGEDGTEDDSEIDEPADDDSEEEESDDEPDEEDEPDPEPDPAQQKAAKAAIPKVKSAKIDAVKELAKENSVRIPPPFLKDIKKLKTYVTGKLEDIVSGEFIPGQKKAKAEKKDKGPSLNSFFEKNVETGFDMEKSEDEVVVAAKEEFPDKPYRVIGNALYAFVKKLG